MLKYNNNLFFVLKDISSTELLGNHI